MVQMLPLLTAKEPIREGENSVDTIHPQFRVGNDRRIPHANKNKRVENHASNYQGSHPPRRQDEHIGNTSSNHIKYIELQLDMKR